MLSVDIKKDKALQGLKTQTKVGKKAMLRTLNLLAKAGKVEASREIKKTFNVKSGPIKKAISIIRATPAKMWSIIRATGKRIPLIAFGGKDGKRGVSVKIKKASGRIRVPGAFIAISKFSGSTIFERQGAARLPITAQTGPSIVQMFTNKDVIARIRARIKKDAGAIFARQYNFLKSKTK